MSQFESGFALGDARGAEFFLEGADMGAALDEAQKLYPRHTPVMFDGDLYTVEREGGDEYSPNQPPSRMPAHALRMSGLGQYEAEEVLALSLPQAYRKLLPFFKKKIVGGQYRGMTTKAYDTVALMRSKFLTENAKLMKGKKGAAGVKPGYSRGANLLPHALALDLSRRRLPMKGLGLCVGSNAACRATCLVYSGQNPVADAQTRVKLHRTESLLREPVAWLRMFLASTQWHIDWCKKRKLVPYLRPNVLSDIPWELVFPDMFRLFPNLSWYDYTKVAGRITGAANYDLTFSFSGTNDRHVEYELTRGHRIAVVFWLPRSCGRVKPPCDKVTDLTFMGQRVLDGDRHDFRPLDPPGSVIGLTYKTPMVGGERLTAPPREHRKFIVPTFRDKDTGALIVAGTPAQLGAEDVFEKAAPTELEVA